MQKDGYVNVAPVLLMIGRLQVSCRVCLMWRRSSGGVPVNPLAYAPCNAGQLPCLFDLEAQGKLQHAPAPRVAAFMSARSKTPYITLVWIFLWEWGSTGAQGAAAGVCLAARIYARAYRSGCTPTPLLHPHARAHAHTHLVQRADRPAPAKPFVVA